MDDEKFFKNLLDFRNSHDLDRAENITDKYFMIIPRIPTTKNGFFPYDFNYQIIFNEFNDKYKYDIKVLKDVSENLEKTSYDSDRLVVLISCQLLSYIHNKKKGGFGLFIRLMSESLRKLSMKKSDILIYSFKILMENELKNPDTNWSNDDIAHVITFFAYTKKLNSGFFQIFKGFSNQVLDKNNDIEMKSNISGLIYRFLNENRDIIKDVNYEDIDFFLKIIMPLISKLDHTALSILNKISNFPDRIKYDDIQKYQKFNFEQIIKMIPAIFITKAKQFGTSIEISRVKIHDIPSSITNYINIQNSEQSKNSKENASLSIMRTNAKLRISSASLLYIDEDQFKGKLDLPPKVLHVEPFLLFKKSSKELQELSTLLKNFTMNLRKDDRRTLLNEIVRLLSMLGTSEGYNPYTVFLMTLNQITDKQICDDYLSTFFGGNLFDADYTVFGPYELDPNINLYRAVVIDMINSKAPSLLFDILKIFKSQPFLFTETIGRIYYTAPIANLASENFFDLISEVNDSLRFLNAPKDARSTILSFIFLYLKDTATSIKCLSSDSFIRDFLKIINEKGLGEMFLLKVVSKSLANLEIELIPKNSSYSLNSIYYKFLFILRDSLINSAKTFDQVDQIIFTFVTNIVKLKPKAVKVFKPFLGLIMEKCSINPSLISTRNAIPFLISLCSFYSANNCKFELEPKYFRILVKNIQFISYSDILNLVCESTNIALNSLFIIKNPAFLPLIFIKFSNDFLQLYNAINHLIILAENSHFNCMALHDGKIDLILLHILNNDNLININEYILDLSEIISGFNNLTIKKFEKRTITYLIKLICSAKSNGEVASYFTKIITNATTSSTLIPEQINCINLTLDILISVMSHISSEPANRYEIGNISETCVVKNLSSKDLNEDFTLFFMLKADQLFFKYSGSVIELLSFSTNHQHFSICLINGVICAKYQRNDLQTRVVICPRIFYNRWDFYSILFQKIKCDQDDSNCEYTIKSYRNLERLHDSDFCNIVFDSGPITLKIGGFSGPAYQNKPYIKQCGFISNIRLYSRLLEKDEIHNCISLSNNAPNDYFFSTLSECGFPSHEEIRLNREFHAAINNTKLSYTFNNDFYDAESLNDCMNHFEYDLIKSFINDLSTNDIDSNYLYKKISLLCFVLNKSENHHLSADFASILFHYPNYISYKLFKHINIVVASIKNYEIKKYWLEDVIFNFALWEKGRDDFIYILTTISNNITHFQEFLNSKSYFSYFLIFFNKHINNSKITKIFIEFLSLVSNIHLKKEDCDLLFSYYENSINKKIYLQLILLISKDFLNCRYQAQKYLLSIMEKELKANPQISDELIQIVIYTILCLHSLYKNQFLSNVISILKLLSIDLNLLLVELEKYIPEYPDLFSLTTAIGFLLKLDTISTIPEFTHKLPELIQNHSKTELQQLNSKETNDQNFWFFFPLLYSLIPSTDEKTRNLIFDFLSTNAIYYSINTGPNTMNCFLSLVILFSFYVQHYSSNDFDPILSILKNMINKLESISSNIKSQIYPQVIFSLLTNSISIIFYNLEGRHYHDALIKKFKEEFKSKEVNYDNFIPKKINKFSFTSLQSVIEFFEKIEKKAFKFTFLFNDDEKKIKYDSLLSILELSKKYIPNSFKIPNQSLKSTISDVNSVIGWFLETYFNHRKPEFPNEKPESPNVKSETIFDMLSEMLTNNFTNIINSISKIITDKDNSSVEVNRKFSQFEPNEMNRIAHLFKLLIDEKTYLVRDLTLNDSFYTHLMKRKKPSNRKILRFQENEILPEKQNVRLIYRDNSILAKLKVMDSLISLSNFETHPNCVKKIPFSMIEMIIYINPRNVLILTNSTFNKTYLIEFLSGNQVFFDKLKEVTDKRNLSNQATTSKFSQLFRSSSSTPVLKFMPNEQEVIQYFRANILDQFWAESSQITAFEYLNVLNLISGRTYLSKTTNYPKFPSIDCFAKNAEGKNNYSKYSNPEDYFFLDGENHQQSYENRKLLESRESTNIIYDFSSKNFDLMIRNEASENDNLQIARNRIKNRQMRNFTTPRELAIISNHKIKFASALQNKTNTFCIVFSNAAIYFIKISFDNNGNSEISIICRNDNLKNSIDFNKTVRFYEISEGVNILTEKSLFTVTLNSFDEKKNVVFEQCLFSGCLFMRTPSIVSQSLDRSYEPSLIKPPIKSYYSDSLKHSSKKGYLENVRDLCFVKHKVVSMAVNEHLNVFAIGCDDCKVRIRNLATGKKIKTVSLKQRKIGSDSSNSFIGDEEIDNDVDDGIPRNILITNIWGFVVVKTLSKLFVFTVNGNLIKSVDDFPAFNKWFNFSSSDGFDFIGFESPEKPSCIFYFEALKPSERKFKLLKINHKKPKIIQFLFDRLWNAFIILSNDGKIHVLPLE